MAHTINYVAPGSSDSRSTIVPNDTTIEELMEDFLEISAGSVGVTVNGTPVTDLNQELNDGDEVVLSSKKHSSGV